MVKRPRRIGFLHPEQELERLRPAFQLLVAVCTHYPIHSDAYRSASKAIDAIHDLAEALSGDPDFFRTRFQ